MSGAWSQAGSILRLGPGGPWFAAVPEDSWPEDAETRQSILKVEKPTQHQLVYCISQRICIVASTARVQ